MNETILVHLGLGSNLGNRQDFIIQACTFLEQNVLKEFRASSIYESEPLMNMPQPQYLNMVVSGYTHLTPSDLLKSCQNIENKLGRISIGRWASRTIDIDILSYENKCINTESINIPHNQLGNRAFVLLPLLEINPDWQHPITKENVELIWTKWKNIHEEPIPEIFAGPPKI